MAKESSEVEISVGQRLNYVMADGQIRPFDVVVHEGSIASGYVLQTSADGDNMPEGVNPYAVTVSFSPHVCVPVPLYVEKVAYDETRKPGTYHFSEDDAEDGLSLAVLQEQVDDLRKQIKSLTKKPKAEKVTEMPTPA